MTFLVGLSAYQLFQNLGSPSPLTNINIKKAVRTQEIDNFDINYKRARAGIRLCPDIGRSCPDKCRIFLTLP